MAGHARLLPTRCDTYIQKVALLQFDRALHCSVTHKKRPTPYCVQYPAVPGNDQVSFIPTDEVSSKTSSFSSLLLLIPQSKFICSVPVKLSHFQMLKQHADMSQYIKKKPKIFPSVKKDITAAHMLGSGFP